MPDIARPSPRVLIVANRTAATAALLEAVRERAGRDAAHFHLVVPATPHGLHRVVDPEVAGRTEAERASTPHSRCSRVPPAGSSPARSATRTPSPR